MIKKITKFICILSLEQCQALCKQHGKMPSLYRGPRWKCGGNQPLPCLISPRPCRGHLLPQAHWTNPARRGDELACTHSHPFALFIWWTLRNGGENILKAFIRWGINCFRLPIHVLNIPSFITTFGWNIHGEGATPDYFPQGPWSSSFHTYKQSTGNSQATSKVHVIVRACLASIVPLRKAWNMGQWRPCLPTKFSIDLN